MPLGIVIIRSRGRDATWRIREAGGVEEWVFTDANLKTAGWGALRALDIVQDLDVEFDSTEATVANVRRYVVAPERTRRLVDRHGCGHVGLALERFSLR